MAQFQLTLPQRRALYSSLRLFEQSLLEADEMLQSRDTVGSLYVRKTTMQPENIRQVRKKIAEALSAVSVLARRLANLALEINQVISASSPQPGKPRRSGYVRDGD